MKKTTESAKILEEQTKIVDLTTRTFEQISEATKASTDVVNEIPKASIAMGESNRNVQEILQSLSAVAQENAASTEEVSATVEEQASSIKQISQASEELSRLAQELNEQISKFNL